MRDITPGGPFFGSGHEEIGPHVLRQYLSAVDAAALLGIRRASLYAYVSRGWLRSVVGEKKTRTRLYLRQDVERLLVRSKVRSGSAAVAASAMNWGEPIIATGITEITNEGPRYRGVLAIDMAREKVPFEQVAHVLWTGSRDGASSIWEAKPMAKPLAALLRSLRGKRTGDQLTDVFCLVTMQLAMGRGSAVERVKSGQTLAEARHVIHTLVGCFGFLSEQGRYHPVQSDQSIAAGLLLAMSHQPSKKKVEILNAVLTLLADHELSPGTVAARIAASSGSALHSCLAAAIATSSGTEVARLYDIVEQSWSWSTSQADLVSEATRLLETGGDLPGFGHPLYPQGDPRAKSMMTLLKGLKSSDPLVCAVVGFVNEMRDRHGLHARHELVLIALIKAVGLPRQAPAALFVLARTAGWVAHVLEQRATGTLLRPRAKFTKA